MWLIDQVGSVLVADATGSGKTRMGAEILRAMVNRLWSRGRVRNHIPVILAPPRVLKNWERDARAINLAVATTSHAFLSGSTDDHQEHQGVLQRAQVVAIDEAHNFLNRDSNRSRTLLRAAPEHTLLLTATPINREAGDLLTIINMLGPDNFDDQIIDLVVDLAYMRAPRGERALVSDEQYERLQRAIRQFTLRRTKRHFNALIRQQPDAYHNRLGQPCRYPDTEAHFYPTGEGADDERLMAPIHRALSLLQGAAFFHRTLRLPDSPAWRGRPHPEVAWLDSMLRGAKALARYHVLAALRSSRVAALEHLVGTREAWQLLGYGEEPPLKQNAETGNMRDRIREKGGQLPQNELGIEDIPIFLRDADAHRQICERESQIYAGLVKLIRAISDRREETKATLIAELLQRRPLALAFDARPITLHDIARRLTARGITVRLATPEVVRRLEQRDGRLSRMDSGHAMVESWLPQDGPAFAPREGEELIFQRYRVVQTLIGGNVTLPGGLDEEPSEEVPLDEAVSTDGEVLTPDALVARRKRAEAESERIPDAFSPVRELVSGTEAIIAEDIYLHYRGVQARVVSAVAAVRSPEPWAFLCLAGSEDGAPRFVLLAEMGGTPLTALEPVCEALRLRLGPSVAARPFDTTAATQLHQALDRLNAAEELMLPRKKQRALTELRLLLDYFGVGQAPRRGRKPRAAAELDERWWEAAGALCDLLDGPRVREGRDGRRIMVDLGVVADRWLTLLRPAWLAVGTRFVYLAPAALNRTGDHADSGLGSEHGVERLPLLTEGVLDLRPGDGPPQPSPQECGDL